MYTDSEREKQENYVAKKRERDGENVDIGKKKSKRKFGEMNTGIDQRDLRNNTMINSTQSTVSDVEAKRLQVREKERCNAKRLSAMWLNGNEMWPNAARR